MGFGLQRYQNSGAAVRAVGALAAITGNLGIPGGGANYSCGYARAVKPDLLAKEKVHPRISESCYSQAYPGSIGSTGKNARPTITASILNFTSTLNRVNFP